MTSARVGFKLLAMAWLVLAGVAQGHQIPSIQLEVDIQNNGPHTLRLNIDPRLVISSTPASMPPVCAEWYREHTPEELIETSKKTIAYIGRTLQFAGTSDALTFQWTVRPMDGVSNQPLSEGTTEVHLLAETSYKPSQGVSSLVVTLVNDAAAALTIITLTDGEVGQRPQVLFPGESSKPLTWKTSEPTPSPPPPPDPFKWYAEPLKLAWSHVFREGLLVHAWFVLLVSVCTRKPIQALAAFHIIHLAAAFACSIHQTVLPQAVWMWPLSCLALLVLPAMKGGHLILGGLILSALALLHVLNEWPTAAEPRIVILMEMVLFVSHLILVLPLLVLLSLWKTKKAAARLPSHH